MEPTYFPFPAAFRQWLEANHDTVSELLLGFYKKGSGTAGITYQEALDEALCFGWIDGVRRRVDTARFTIRFTPRKRGSVWSEVNTKRVAELTSAGRMHAAGLRAFAARDGDKTRQYSYEERSRPLDEAYELRFREDGEAWQFFEAQPPSYRRAATWWVMSAKREETRLKRLAVLMEDSANGRRLAAVTYTPERWPNGKEPSRPS